MIYNIFYNMWSWLTMRRQECLFVDRVTGEEVYRYVDGYGVEWMGNYPLLWSRVKREAEDVDSDSERHAISKD